MPLDLGPHPGDVAPAGIGLPAISARSITRRFPGVLANDRVSFDVWRGEIHGLLGENGSGKTTLCRILTGLYRPDSGEILIDGKAVSFASPRDGYAAGVFMVQQHFSLVERLTVGENVVLGWTRQPYIHFDRRKVEAEVAATAAEFHMDVDPSAFVWQLSVGERQRVEILKALYRGSRILILDEPTTVLTPQESLDLFRTLRQMAAQGSSIVFISHKLPEVLALCDTVTVLRQGRAVGNLALRGREVRAQELARLMVGRDVALPQRDRSRLPSGAPVVLDVAGLTVKNDFGRKRVRDLSLSIHKGEIVGIAGVAGNGQRELAEAVAGLRMCDAGSVSLNGVMLRAGDPSRAIHSGLAYVPEDRLGTALVPSLSVADNVVLKDSWSPLLSWGPFIRREQVLDRTKTLVNAFNVQGRAGSLIRQLSGGNAQKVVLARELSSNPVAIVVASPTRGLDIGATQNVRDLLLGAAQRGLAVLLISEDLDEVLELSDRVAVMYDGQITGIVDPTVATRDQIGLLMAGMGVATP